MNLAIRCWSNGWRAKASEDQRRDPRPHAGCVHLAGRKMEVKRPRRRHDAEWDNIGTGTRGNAYDIAGYQVRCRIESDAK
jgi:hypothetical protein